jgi:hypothetical protein
LLLVVVCNTDDKDKDKNKDKDKENDKDKDNKKSVSLIHSPQRSKEVASEISGKI